MIEKYPRDWDGKEWQHFSLRLVRERHKPENVQPIPDRVHGDLGIECVTMDGCVYQSYAPEETSDTAKAASAMKAKANRDLEKLITYSSDISKILGKRKIRRWILLCPFLDDKSVLKTVTTKAQKVFDSGLPFLESDFCGLVHCQDDFAKEIDRIRLEASGAALSLTTPTKSEIADAENTIDETLENKIGRGFPQDDEAQAAKRKDGFLRSHVRAENALEQLKRDAPELWERATTTIALEEDRLLTTGTGSGSAADLLVAEQDRLYAALNSSIPTLDPNSVRAIASGQIGTWLIECPLDFTTNFKGTS